MDAYTLAQAIAGALLYSLAFWAKSGEQFQPDKLISTIIVAILVAIAYPVKTAQNPGYMIAQYAGLVAVVESLLKGYSRRASNVPKKAGGGA